MLDDLRIPLENVLEATNNFHHDNLIGHGDFGPAYKGQLVWSGKSTKIIARRLDRKCGLRDPKYFLTEVSTLSGLKHANLVSIIGFCDEKSKKIIINTYEANGSLERFLNSPNFTWTQRLNVCLGVAHALSYLHSHEGCDYAVIHRFVNSSTILLDENWEAKLSGFEIAIKQPIQLKDQVALCDPIGKVEYTDPTTEKNNGVTYKSDIYSFGVVLFEILCGRKAFDLNEEDRFLVPMATYHYEHKMLSDLIQPDLWNEISMRSMLKYSEVAYACLKEEPTHRPNANNIIDELKKSLEFQMQRENLEKKLVHLKIHLGDIKQATNNFSNKHGIVDFNYYKLYRAELKHFDKENHSFIEQKNKGEHPKRQVTMLIKRYRSDEKHVHAEEEALTELEMLTSAKHPNIVTLHGFCFKGSEMIIVTENVSNGHLGSYLGNVSEMSIFTWERRLKISIDIARALNYLHYEMEDQKIVINRDINSYNIGLDDNMRVKIVDFRVAVFLPTSKKDKGLGLPPIGKMYYVDPEYENTRRLKRESDVYGFGVVLFEILCGRTAADDIYCKESHRGLGPVARQRFCTQTLDEIIDPIIKKETDEKRASLDTFIKIANRCIAKKQKQRPTMKIVIEELEKALSFQENLVQVPHIDQVVDKSEGTLELQSTPQTLELDLTQEYILRKKLEHLQIPLNDIKLATQYFSREYVVAPFKTICLYAAILEHFDQEKPSSEGNNNGEHPKKRNTVTLKRYPSGNPSYGEKQFFHEIGMLTSVKHHNIVSLLGFCIEDSEMIIVTENVSNGYLSNYLGVDDKLRILTWEKRLKICIDVAHALNYLHYEMEDKTIINLAINSHNIGLDENFGAKIVEFFISVILPPNLEDETHYHKRVGTAFHMDPEYAKTCKLKRESDVYSFGVVLFEILCGRVAGDPIYLKENDEGLAYVARQSFCMRTLEEMIDPIIKKETAENNSFLNGGPNKDSLYTFFDIAYRCVAEKQNQRPTMKVVIEKLEKALYFQKNNKDNPKVSLKDINQATQNFDDGNCIGEGGFGSVYTGNLRDGDGFKTIVAKRLDTRLGQGKQQFLCELQILLKYKHENVIDLVGYCDEKDENILIYEYMPRGSLDKYLNDAYVTWVKRLNICIDVASALDFIHGGYGKQAKVIHRDIKAANILLNHDWKAKLADFGLSLISHITQEKDYVIDNACGTPGYVDPLYYKSKILTIESDIYSFGVVLFEILGGRSTFAIHEQEGHYLPDFVKNKFEERKHDKVVFEQIREQIVSKSLATFQEIAYQCLHHEREKRPTTKRVLRQLKKALEFQNMSSTITKFTHIRIPIEEVVKATNNFHDDNIIRHGDYGRAYKGQLFRSGRLMEIVAQRFDCTHWEGELEFLTEISVLYDLKHTNLFTIIGFCDEKDERIIITPYEANKTLGRYLNNPNLTWAQRLRISVGVAHALSYVHYNEGRSSNAIIHCNINSETIFLDENSEAKLVYYKDQVCLCEHNGMMGCMGGVTQMPCIYSFGVVLFEMLCGRKAFIQNEANRFLTPLAKLHYENNTLRDIIHADLYDQMSPKSLLIYSNIAYSCLNEDPANRPYMNYIISELETALELQLQRENIRNNFEHLRVPLDDIKSATHNFSDINNFRSDGCDWFKAELEHFNKEYHSSVKGKNEGDHPKRHNTVVIKRFSRRAYGEEVMFTEMEILAGVEHHSIITLLGFCVEDSEMILITENASNRYLSDHLEKVNMNKMRIFTWEKRLKICVDVAHALNYIHYEMKDQKMIINRRIDSKYIMLDKNLRAKLVDFRYSVFLPPNQEDVILYDQNIIRRRPYTDPEHMKTGKLKRESDVYSFGIVMFEILSGRRGYGLSYFLESPMTPDKVPRPSLRTKLLEEIMDPTIKEETDENGFVRGPNKDSLDIFIKIAFQCLAKTQEQRPTMKVVVKELEKALSFQISRDD